MALAPLAPRIRSPLPVAGDQAAFDFLRPVLDVGHADQLAAKLAALRLAAAGGPGMAQAADLFAPQLVPRQGVDRLVRHAKARFLLQSRVLPLAPARDLLRRPPQSQQAGRFSEQRAVRRHPCLAPGQFPLGRRLAIGRARLVIGAASVPGDLVRNRAGGEAQPKRDLPDPPAVAQSEGDRGPVDHSALASLNCHCATLNYPVKSGVFAPELESADGFRSAGGAADFATIRSLLSQGQEAGFGYLTSPDHPARSVDRGTSDRLIQARLPWQLRITDHVHEHDPAPRGAQICMHHRRSGNIANPLPSACRGGHPPCELK